MQVVEENEMKKWNVGKILIIISIIIICLGIISGISISNELENALPTEKIYVDGSDFSMLVQLGGTVGSRLLEIVIVIYSILIDLLIWIIYGIVLVIMKIIRKIH